MDNPLLAAASDAAPLPPPQVNVQYKVRDEPTGELIENNSNVFKARHHPASVVVNLVPELLCRQRAALPTPMHACTCRSVVPSPPHSPPKILSIFTPKNEKGSMSSQITLVSWVNVG